MNISQYGSLAKANSINRGDLRNNPEFRNPTQDDKGKPMYDKNGKFVGTFIGLENNGYFGPLRAKNALNEEDTGLTYTTADMYVEINPAPRNGGKSRRRQTKKTRRGKSKRRGKKTRGRKR